MVLSKKLDPQTEMAETKDTSSRKTLALSARLEELESRPHRGALLHWLAFVFSVVSFVILAMWVFSARGAVSSVFIILDIILGVL
jgi:large-conductance mechanosensitive channel